MPDPGQTADGRIQLIILGGFLGSGKTTWLRHQLHAGQFRDAFVIVNEAAETPVDDALLTNAAGLAVLAGGCVCCTGQADLITLLRSLCDTRSKTDSLGKRLSRIVLETSGLADPALIVAAIRADPMLVYHILVTEVLVTVDALHGLAQLQTEPLGRCQIEIADRLILTKLDAADPHSVAVLQATLAVMNPGATLCGAIKGSATPLPLPDPAVPAAALSALDGIANAAPIFPTQIMINDSIDWTAFTVWLSALLHARGDDVMRVKGVIRTPAGRLLLQTVRKVVQSPEILPEPADDHAPRPDGIIVVIGRGYRADDLRQSLRHFAAVGRSPVANE